MSEAESKQNRWVNQAPNPGQDHGPELPMPPVLQLEVGYLTDPEIYRAVLPPPLEPAPEPRVHVRVADIDIEFGDFKHRERIGFFALDAIYEGELGEYPLIMPLDNVDAITPSRERFGEPKMLAEVSISREGNHVEAKVTRRGVTFIEMTGEVTETLPCPEPYTHREWWFKYLPTVAGDGFEAGPWLVKAETETRTKSLEKVEGKLVLRDSPADPVVDLPVRELGRIQWRVFEGTHQVHMVGPIDGEAFKPYAAARFALV